METPEAIANAMRILDGFMQEMVKEATGVHGITYKHIFAMFAKTIVMNFVHRPEDTAFAVRMISDMIEEGAIAKVGSPDRIVH